MAKRMPIRRVLSLVVLLAAGTLCATVTAAAVPESDAVVLKQLREYTLNADGSLLLRVHEQKKLLTGFAMNRLLGETFIPFADGGQELKIVRCVTTMVDGTQVPTPANGFNEITHPDVYQFPELCHLREMVVSHTGLEIGAVTDLEYTVTSKPGFHTFLEAVEPFGGALPVQDLTVRVTVPRGTALSYAASGPVPKPLVKNEGDAVRYEWRAVNVPAQLEERLAPERCLVVPTLFFTIARSWKERLAGLPAPALAPADAEALLGGPVTEPPTLALLLRVAEAAAKGARKVGVPPAALGGAVTAPESVFTRCYGTAPERALLLQALLQAAGFPRTELVAALPPVGDLGRIPVMSAVKDWYVRVEVGGETLLLTPDADLLSAGAVSPDQHLLVGLSGVALAASKGAPSRFALQCRIKGWDGGRCKLEGALELSGRLVRAGKAAQDAAKEAEKVLGEILHDWGVEKIQVKVHTGGPAGLSFSFTAEAAGALRTNGSYRSLAVPIPAAVASWRDLFRVADRQGPVLLPVAPLDVRLDLVVELPPGMTVQYLPQTLKASNACATFSQEVSADAKQITIRRSTEVPRASLGAAECAVFKQAVAPWFLESQGEVILKTAK